MRIADLLDEKVIKIGLECKDKEECIEEMVDLLVRAERVSDRQGALTALKERERLQSTGIGNGAGVPHAKDGSVRTLTAALGTSAGGIEFDSVDGQPVHVVFLVLAEADNPRPQISALAEIARLLQLPGFYRQIVKAKSPRELFDLISEEE